MTQQQRLPRTIDEDLAGLPAGMVATVPAAQTDPEPRPAPTLTELAAALNAMNAVETAPGQWVGVLANGQRVRITSPTARARDRMRAALTEMGATQIEPGIWSATGPDGQEMQLTIPRTWDLYDAARAAADWLDEHNGADTAEQAARILKVTEEAGEVAAAWIGVTGQNPRKGYSHTHDDVAAELADVVLAALVAVESLGLDPAEVMATAVHKVMSRVGPATREHAVLS